VTDEQSPSRLEIDPTAYDRFMVTSGVGARTVDLLGGFGRVSPVPVGAPIAEAAWDRIDLFVVGIDAEPRSPGVGLTSPVRTAALANVIRDLKRAGATGVERVVIEGTLATQPHTGVLRAFCELYLAPQGRTSVLNSARPLSAPARELARAHRALARTAKGRR